MENKAFENISIKKIIKEFNSGEFRRSSIPLEVVSGWPCLSRLGKTLCLTIPYFSRKAVDKKAALYPIYCSVTIPLGNPEKIVDYTLYPIQKEWKDVDYKKPVGYFKHEALNDVATKGEYTALRDELYGYIDEMAKSIINGKPFEQAEAASKLFSKLMEPGLYPYYLRINKKFYSFFCENKEEQ
ncbi:MAG: hypothetical protein J1G06_01225 [Oscillospiraceae bacterium]|nr:hypothetical protein [Oscillospiraceae bacterium]